MTATGGFMAGASRPCNIMSKAVCMTSPGGALVPDGVAKAEEVGDAHQRPGLRLGVAGTELARAPAPGEAAAYASASVW